MQYSIDGSSSFLVLAGVGSLVYPLIARIYPRLCPVLSFMVWGLHSISLLMLVYFRISNDFSFEHVYQNSHTLQPLLYKITGVWGNYEGSYLLFIWLMSSYAVMMELILPDKLRGPSTSVQHLIITSFTCFSVLWANPFLKIFHLDDDGLGFNPLLQDIGLSIHPPILFGGYTGFSPVLSVTLASLGLNVDPVEWSKLLRGWVLAAWSLLTLGIALGGWWAYRILGWGGFWAWDPVENLVLLPWLIGTALVHMMPVVRKSRIYCNLTFFLACSVFLCSLYSTFLVRSGFLISVHSFADDEARGFFLMIMINTIVLICYAAFALLCRKRKESCDFSYISKITALVSHTVLLLTGFFVVFTGTVYPVLHEILTGETVSVGSPYYNSIFGILLIIMLCILVILPCLSWDGKKPFHLSFKISSVFVGIGLPVALYFGMHGIIILLAIFLFLSIFEDFFHKLPYPLTWEEARLQLRLGRCAMISAHVGVAVLVIGVVYSSTNQLERHKYMRVGDSIGIGEFQAKLSDVKVEKKEYYDALIGKFIVTRVTDDRFVGTLFPENRFYHVEATRNPVSSIHHSLLADLYIVIGDIDVDRGVAVQFRYKPLIFMVWLGSLLIVAGGILGVINAVKQVYRGALQQPVKSVGGGYRISEL